MKKIRVRKNKNYTSVIMQEITLEAFKEAKEIYQEIAKNGEPAVINISKKAYQEFFSLHTLTFDEVEAGEEYKVLGTTYKIIRNSDNSRGNEWFPKYQYFNKQSNEKQEVGALCDNVARAFLEHSFANYTGLMLFC